MTDQPIPSSWGVLDSLPGNPLMWVLIISELLVFGGFFTAFSAAGALHPEAFAASQSRLDRVAGGINTMVLLSSGLAAAIALNVRANGNIWACRVWLGAAAALGVTFLGVKAGEYADKAAQGIGLETNDFFTLFYLMTGFHALHVVLGLILLAIVAWKCSIENVETGTAFWHMVDLIWVLLYPIVYLIR